jgi:hypothetical protein
MQASVAAVTKTLLGSLDAATRHDTPYRHWFVEHCLPNAMIDELLALPFEAPQLGGISGKRELHNVTRKYFDVANSAKYPVCETFCAAFQSSEMTDGLTRVLGAQLEGTYLRIEYAQDTDGFWLEPHTDLGVKAFTMLLYLSRDPGHTDLGTDIYDHDKVRVGRSSFVSNSAMIFLPSATSYHGFDPRKINGVRKSIVINYVTKDWRAREQLAFPDTPIS